MKENSGDTGLFARGVDIPVSHATIDWKSAAAAGVSFAYLISTRGVEKPDEYFAANWKSMKLAGVLRGACHYFQPLKDAEAQAVNFAESVGSLDTNDLPPALRLKGVQTHTGMNEWDGVRPGNRLSVVTRCLTSIEKACGHKPIVFTNAWFINRQLEDSGELAAWDLWVADYSKADAPPIPAKWNSWKFWRYSESGEIPGIPGRTSLNYFNGSASDLHSYAGGVTSQPASTEQTPAPTEETPAAATASELRDDRDDERAAASESTAEQARLTRGKRISKRDG